MKKALFIITAIFCILEASFSEAPELKNMMPNSWQKLTRLSENEEKEFLSQQQVTEDIANFKSYSWSSTEYTVTEKRVYKEIANNVEFYRVLACNQKMADFLESTYCDKTVANEDYKNFKLHRIRQTVYAKQESKEIYKIAALQYRHHGIAEGNMETGGCEYFVFNDLLIKELNKDEIGFFITEASIGYQIASKD